MASVQFQWRVETDSRLLWPELSQPTAKCCCAGPTRNSVWTGVKNNQWYATTDIINAFFLNPFGSRVQATVCFHLEWCPVHLELTAPGVGTQLHHLPRTDLPWTDLDCTWIGWSSWTPAIHWRHHHVRQHSRRTFRERWENSPKSSKSQFCHKEKNNKVKDLHRRSTF